MRISSLLLLSLAAACGSTGKTASVDSGVDAGGTDAAAEAGSDAHASPPADSGMEGSVADASTGLGCAEGGMCPLGKMCCVGVPYPKAGACSVECNLDSDRALKDKVVPIDAEAVLARVEKLPIASWHYRSEPGDVRHTGPMAQDFHQAFGVGADDRHIHPVDGIGVSLAAIQALARRVDRVEAENKRLRLQLETLERVRR